MNNSNLENPYQSPVVDPAAAASPLKSPRARLLGPALGILLPSLLHSLGGLFYFVYSYSIISDSETSSESARMQLTLCLYFGISVLYCLVLASGAYSMMRLGSYMWAMAVCILACVPFFGPCYFFAIPFGIWGIIVLRRPDVRDSFRSF